MKKFIVLLSVFLLTGCINGNRDFEATCKKSEQSEGFSEDISYKIYYNSSYNITKLVEKYNIKYSNDVGMQSFQAAKISLKSYGNSKNYTINIIKDTEKEYEVDFTLNINKMKDEELKKIGMKRYYYDQKNIYAQSMTCR